MKSSNPADVVRAESNRQSWFSGEFRDATPREIARSTAVVSCVARQAREVDLPRTALGMKIPPESRVEALQENVARSRTYTGAKDLTGCAMSGVL